MQIILTVGSHWPDISDMDEFEMVPRSTVNSDYLQIHKLRPCTGIFIQPFVVFECPMPSGYRHGLGG